MRALHDAHKHRQFIANEIEEKDSFNNNIQEAEFTKIVKLYKGKLMKKAPEGEGQSLHVKIQKSSNNFSE